MHFLYEKLAQKIQRQKVSRKKLLKDFCTKRAHKTLMKLTPTVFIENCHGGFRLGLIKFILMT
jgi:hypothetical protein